MPSKATESRDPSSWPAAARFARLCIVWGALVSLPATSARLPSYGAYYQLALRVDPASATLSGIAHIVMSSPPGRSAWLFAAPTLTVDSISASGARVAFERRGDTIMFAAPTRPRVDVRAFYHATAAAALSFDSSSAGPAASTYGLPYSARAWWPAPGSTLAKADSADITVTTPTAYIAASNGRLVSTRTEPDGWVSRRWAVRHPIYPDVMSFAVARYVELRDSARVGSRWVPLSFFVFPNDSANARADFARLPRILEFYSERLGPYPFADEKYGIAEFATQSFREHQTLPSLGPRYITGDRRNEWILAHELAHQWFGNDLSVRRWSDAWLNEGLATYAAMLWKEASSGRAAYDADIKAAAARTFTGALTIADTDDVDHMFTGTTFFKGALFAHALRMTLGDDRFFRALRRYVANNAYGLVSVTDFERAMETECGASLDALFKRWLLQSGPAPDSVAANQTHCPPPP